MTAKKCTKKHDARAKLLFCLINLLLLYDLVAVAVAKAPYYKNKGDVRYQGINFKIPLKFNYNQESRSQLTPLRPVVRMDDEWHAKGFW